MHKFKVILSTIKHNQHFHCVHDMAARVNDKSKAHQKDEVEAQVRAFRKLLKKSWHISKWTPDRNDKLTYLLGKRLIVLVPFDEKMLIPEQNVFMSELMEFKDYV